MDIQSRAAYVQAQAACAMVEAMAMQAENQVRASRGDSPAYGEAEFHALITAYRIHHNDVIEYLRAG